MIYNQGFLNNSYMTLSFNHRSYTIAYVSFCMRRIEVSNFYAIFLKRILIETWQGRNCRKLRSCMLDSLRVDW